MNIVKCDKGHFYNGDKYAACPHCAEKNQLNVENQTNSFQEGQAEKGYQVSAEMPETVAYKPIANIADTIAYVPSDADEDMQPIQSRIQHPVNALPVGWLVAVSGLEYGKQYPIFTSDTTIGSMEKNSICIQGDSYIYPERHCVLSFDMQQQRVVLNMKDSAGEVYLNNKLATESCYLNHRDMLQIGGSVYMLFELCREGFSWWAPLTNSVEETKIDDIEKAFAKEQPLKERINISDIRETVYQNKMKEQAREEKLERQLEHAVSERNPSFAQQSMPVFAEISAKDAAFVAADDTNVLVTQCANYDEDEGTNVLVTRTWRCPMCNGLNSEFANICKICGTKRT